jgi:ADP-L-glycero-D-manno-heptose 6-epimerase
MIMVTGAAGFIGSNLHAALARRGKETVAVDWLGEQGKWQNLAKHPPTRLVQPGALDAFLDSQPPLEMVFHIGAVTDTTATNGDQVWETNVELSNRLWQWCAKNSVRLVYASSSATYGDGTEGFDDDGSLRHLERLRPLNLYGWSKHVFDIQVAKKLAAGAARPPQWVGLKFFNVYGPNEYHKGRMISVVKAMYDDVAAGRPPRVFRSATGLWQDGAQARDMVWVGDVVDVMLWLLDTPEVNGLFNLGTGRARNFTDVAHAICDAAGALPRVEYVDLPAGAERQYQSFTQATTERLRAAGFAGQFAPLEVGVQRYVREYLSTPTPYA